MISKYWNERIKWAHQITNTYEGGGANFRSYDVLFDDFVYNQDLKTGLMNC